MSCIMANTIQLITCNKHSQSKTSGNVHIGHPHCLPLDNHSCSKIKLKGERSCVRLYNSKAIQIHAPFKCSKKFLQPEGSCNRRQGSYQYKLKIISMQILSSVPRSLVQPEGSCNRRQGSYHNTSTK